MRDGSQRPAEEEEPMCPRLVVLSVVSSLVVVSSTRAEPDRERREARAVLVNVAVDAAATASSETADHPAMLATDGNAATTWCPATGSGTLTIDLGRMTEISGFGITLAGAVATGNVEIALAPTPHAFRTHVASLAVSTSAP